MNDPINPTHYKHLPAEASGGSRDKPTPKPSSKQPPKDYRLLGAAKYEPRQAGDLYWSLRAKAWCCIEEDIVEYANRDNWLACRKIETPSEQTKRCRIEVAE